jgi:hypothetical protein
MNERRVKIVRFDAALLVDVFNWWLDPPDFLALPVCEEIPSDAVVQSVNANWNSRSIDLLISHPSFPVVPSGAMPPQAPELITEFRHIAIKKTAQ